MGGRNKVCESQLGAMVADKHKISLTWSIGSSTIVAPFRKNIAISESGAHKHMTNTAQPTMTPQKSKKSRWLY